MAAPVPDGVQMIDVNGRERTFVVRVPVAADRSKPPPVIFAFHGANGSAVDFDRTSNLRAPLGDKAVLVFPGALVSPAVGTTTWARDTADDLAFFDAVVAWLGTRVCYDSARIFAVGLSSGAFFSNTVGCRRGELVRAIGPVAGGPRDMTNCVGTVAAWVSHGTKDTTVSIDVGRMGRDFWITANGCSPADPGPTTPAPCVEYRGCREGYPVYWCEFDGGHHFPTFFHRAIWDFFSRF